MAGAGTARVALIAAESEADRVPQEFETVLAPENRIRVRDLVEEELLLSLPLVPLHADASDVRRRTQPADERKPRAAPRAEYSRDRLNGWASC